jgi:nucleoside-diphosphate-sugar epimerase
VTHRDLVALLLETAGRGSARCVPWPADKQRIDIGSFYSDSTKFTAVTGWQPAVDLAEGFRRTLDYYRAHYNRYVEPDAQGAP